MTLCNWHGPDYNDKHHIALFTGVTTNFDHETTGFTSGVDYEYFFSDLVAAGFIGDYVFSGEGEWILGVPVFIHPNNNFKFGAAPIWIQTEVHHNDHYDDQYHDFHGGSGSDVEKEWNIGVGLKLAYNVHFGQMSAGPSVSLDIANTTDLVYGLALGVGFEEERILKFHDTVYIELILLLIKQY